MTPSLSKQRGVFAIEFSVIVGIFLFAVFTIMEVARALYIANSLQEVTRRAARAAAVTDFSDAAAVDALRRAALFDGAGGKLPLGAPVTAGHLKVDYLSLQNTGGGMTQVPIPSAALTCPARNRLVCTADSGDPNCIRFVRVRVCQPNTNCTPVPYESVGSIANFPITLPVSTTIVRAESLGYAPGMAMCN